MLPFLNVIYEDRDVFVVNKPSGLLSVPGRGEEKFDSVQSRCQALCAGAMAVHRLDMATSGILMIAKHKEAERHYKTVFEKRFASKTYIAIAQGIMSEKQGSMTEPMRTDWERRPIQMIDFEQGKPAHTDFEVLSYEQGHTRVKLYPHTGRSHQLRLHLAHRGHPILGDEFYGNAQLSPRLLLHATALKLPRLDGKSLHIICPTPF
ncbi:MAG: RluA family pseudouridine synthase [Cardiobacteriaceae bacterium]|nr:RluA family pseudouridine synthase [Cardiobacteriaceae bacterium]